MGPTGSGDQVAGTEGPCSHSEWPGRRRSLLQGLHAGAACRMHRRWSRQVNDSRRRLHSWPSLLEAVYHLKPWVLPVHHRRRPDHLEAHACIQRNLGRGRRGAGKGASKSNACRCEETCHSPHRRRTSTHRMGQAGAVPPGPSARGAPRASQPPSALLLSHNIKSQQAPCDALF